VGAPAVVAQRREVDARGDGLAAALADEPPREPHAVVVRVGAGGQLEAVAGELLLGARHHGVDPGVALARHDRVQVAGVVGPGLGDERAPALGARLVPHRDVAIHDGVDVGHVDLLIGWCARRHRDGGPGACRLPAR
jgi:hypothetical protein